MRTSGARRKIVAVVVREGKLFLFCWIECVGVRIGEFDRKSFHVSSSTNSTIENPSSGRMDRR